MPANGVARHFLSFVVLAATAASVQPAAGQGMLVDVRPESHWRLPRPILPQPPPPASSYRISSLEVNVRLKGAVAQVQVGQTFENTGSGQIEAALVFPLPYDGAIDALTLMVDGREYPAKLLDADEARKQYEQIVRTSRDPALLQWVGVGMFQTSVFPIPPGAKRTVTIRYSQLCRQSQGLTDFLFPLSTARYTSGPIEKLSLRVAIEGEAALKTVYSPTHAVNVERPDEKSAVVTVDVRDAIPAADFRLFAQAEAGDLAASVVSYRPDEKEDGYFLLLATPPIEQPEAQRLPKTVVFVVDRSGSMSGAKMEQAREALKFVLNNLRAGDTFNIVAYDSEVEAFRPELEKFDEQSRLAALGFVNGLFAGGTTNIDGALSRALGMIQDAGRPAYVLFLTDGIPTFGETSEARIARNAEAANQFGARIFTFGVGYDLNSRLLDKLARSGRGQTEFVRPEENVEAAVSSLYRRIGAPVMTDVTFSLVVEKRIVDGQEIVDGWDGVSRVYPRDRFDLFAGDQFVLGGR
ncbi:MAG TPA: VIT domain-containing protein, partial [Lacipirellulaceae bacterium]|nr:VIT domain-containing protein [Lacipirellulaceae bacterium]